MSTPESSWERSTTRPVFTVIDPELDRGFISNGGAARLTIFNTNTLETIGQVKSTGENPGRPSLIPRRSVSLPFNLNSHNATVVDSKESKVVGAFDLGGRLELVGSYRVFETVKTTPGARNMALDLNTKKMFLPLSDREPPPPAT